MDLYNMRKEYILHTSKGMEKMYATVPEGEPEA